MISVTKMLKRVPHRKNLTQAKSVPCTLFLKKKYKKKQKNSFLPFPQHRYFKHLSTKVMQFPVGYIGRIFLRSPRITVKFKFVGNFKKCNLSISFGLKNDILCHYLFKFFAFKHKLLLATVKMASNYHKFSENKIMTHSTLTVRLCVYKFLNKTGTRSATNSRWEHIVGACKCVGLTLGLIEAAATCCIQVHI